MRRYAKDAGNRISIWKQQRGETVGRDVGRDNKLLKEVYFVGAWDSSSFGSQVYKEPPEELLSDVIMNFILPTSSVSATISENYFLTNR